MVRYKQKSLISNIVANEAVDANKKRDSSADKKLNAAADKAVNIDKTQDTIAELSILIND